MTTVAILFACLATVACVATAGLCFLVGLKDAGARTGSLGGLLVGFSLAQIR